MSKKNTEAREHAGTWTTAPGIALHVRDGFQIAPVATGSTPGWHGDKKAGKAAMKERGKLLAELQERLYAEARQGGERRVLLVVQGMDTAGKGGICRHVLGMVDPQGVHLRSFGVPTAEELSHDFLWRIRRALPPAGMIGVFDRSHYEDVLVGKVDELATPAEIEARYEKINEFERELVDAGYTLVKVALLIGYEEQGLRLLRRLARRDKHWKYSPSDVEARAQWPAYMDAYQAMFERTSTEYAPWYAVPADRKWFARLAVTELLAQALARLAPRWPEVRWDPRAQAEQVLATMPRHTAQLSADELRQEAEEVAAESEDYRNGVEMLITRDSRKDAGERVGNGQ
ncbi:MULTISPECIES: PPK2 family polyphosphate kinase [Actinotignum]|uniref:Polyphosphate kinase 2 family protein n=2 Tax=Actinotignum TaxID=1653174 RepID=A0AAW9HKL1_9ACTO|nr:MULTISPECIES: PPK2 family polyphosphate kinase [Actinotignum]MDE1559090.1 polyphosphate kinase 2 family protein [Actinotignum schaalii]MDE1664059.1 polyphosphate kinase 2 family protein [Actinotignum schaalii]MDK6373821.1 polyphosphate kinase 2 family protein [Actinotignum timonense]MDK6419287.1 polyphosphate kinase 2 family protein [Actinotignum timonense]MDK6591271.1 polyphosphate kinase 2 family protein [Actinotignum timonense]